MIDETLGYKDELQNTIDAQIKHKIPSDTIFSRLVSHIRAVFEGIFKALMWGKLDYYREDGVEKYIYLTRDDDSVCINCARLHEEVMLIENAVEGVNFPQMHLFCRCDTMPVYSDTYEQSLEEREKYYDDDGNPKWPDNDGFDGDPENVTLQPKTRIDKYGDERGSYAAPKGTPYSQRSLPRGSDRNEFHEYEVLKPIQAKGGKTAPWFGEQGGGTQYKFNETIEELIETGFLRRIK